MSASLVQLCAACADGGTSPQFLAPPQLQLPPPNPPLFLSACQLADYFLGLELSARLAALRDVYDGPFPDGSSSRRFYIGPYGSGGIQRGATFFALLAPLGAPLPFAQVFSGVCAVGVRSADEAAAGSVAYAALMDDLQPQIDSLVADVQASMGGAFSAVRRELYGGAAAGAAFALGPVMQILTGSGLNGDGAGGALAFGAGSWRVQVSADATSRATSNPASIALSIAVDGSVVATETLTRASTNVDDSMHFELDHTVTLSGSAHVITIVNAGSSEQDARGVVRVFPA